MIPALHRFRRTRATAIARWAALIVLALLVPFAGAFPAHGERPPERGATAKGAPAAHGIDGVRDLDGVDEARDVHVVPGGALRFERPYDFGLAVKDEQLLVRSYIPPCDFGFDYCLYYMAHAYDGTNFESAGLRIDRRADLSSEERCLATPPAGYADFEPDIRRGDGYAVSTFAPLGEAAMGHYASGALYRLFAGSECYEFETRIGQSQFLNYEPGMIEEFTEDDMKALEKRLGELLSLVRLADRPEVLIFPPPEPERDLEAQSSSRNLNCASTSVR